MYGTHCWLLATYSGLAVRVKKVESGREDKAFLTLPGTVLDRDKEKTELRVCNKNFSCVTLDGINWLVHEIKGVILSLNWRASCSALDGSTENRPEGEIAD